MSENPGEWLYQTSIKFGPRDNKGDPMFLTNVRSYTAREHAEQIQELIEEYWAIVMSAVQKMWAMNTMGQQFQLEQVPAAQAQGFQQQAPQACQQQASAQSPAGGGEICAHGMPRVWKSGVKNNKPWAGWMCQVPKEQGSCAPKWVQ